MPDSKDRQEWDITSHRNDIQDVNMLHIVSGMDYTLKTGYRQKANNWTEYRSDQVHLDRRLTQFIH
jgi:hypothetical protein